MIDIRQAMTDPALLGPVFGGESFAAWRALLSGFYGLDLDATELDTFKTLTGRESEPQGAFAELWLAIGRRGGKSHAAAFLAVYLAAFMDYRDKLAPGEVATVMVIAADRKQARAVMRYTSGLLNENPMLRRMVQRENSEQIELNNRTVIEITTASHRSVRGYTLAACICDEIAFWHVDGASPDREIIAAIRPALATLGGKLVALSSPYAKRGILWDTFKRTFADDAESRVLVAKAPSRLMNPTLPQYVVDDAMREDPEAARAEYLAEFRSDVSTFLDADLLAGCVRPEPLEMHPARGVRYVAFVDPAGGGADEFTLAIGHQERGQTVLDVVRGLRGSPAQIVAEYADLLKRYNITRIRGDRYAGRWPRDEFARFGIEYDVSEMDRSALYLEFLAALNSGRVELPPDERLQRQLIGLERRAGRGRDVIDHAPGANDDRANAVAGVVAHVTRRRAETKISAVVGLW
jgi:hypothetical protein